MADSEKTLGVVANENNDSNEKKSDSESKLNTQNDNEDADSLEEQPLDIGEHYVVKRSDETWRKSTQSPLYLIIQNVNTTQCHSIFRSG